MSRKTNHRLVITRSENKWSTITHLHRSFRHIYATLPNYVQFPHHTCRVELLLADDKALLDLNYQYRNRNKTTDVLSFPDGNIHRNVYFMGEIALSLQQVLTYAAERNTILHKIQIEGSDTDPRSILFSASHLLLHGLLHLLGFDHQTDKEATAMETLEARILTDFRHQLTVAQAA